MQSLVKKPKWGYFPSEGHPEVVTNFEGTKATPEFLQAIAYEVYVKNVTFGLLHQWLTDMGMTISKNTLRNWLKKGKTYLDELVCVLKSIALEKDSIVNCDETWCKVRKYDHYKKCYIWVLVNKAQKTAIFFYENGSRGRDVLTDFLGDAELKSIMSDGYNAYVFIGNELKSARFKDTVHQVCMSHAKNKFVKASNQGGEPTAERFSEILKEFFMRERKYDDAGLTPKERFRERQSLATKELLIELRSLLDSELTKDSEFRSRYYKEALNYLNRFWKEIFAYLDDGELPIDNNLAERTIRKLTTQRNNSLHYGSDVLTDFLGDAELKSIMSDGYNAYVFIGNELKSARFKDTVHQVCMSHAKNKFVKASNQGGEPTAERFSEILKEFFMRERKYDDAGLTPKERFRERQSLATKELLIELRSLLDSELTKDSEFRSRYYKEALNYLNRFWKEIFAYLDDGELPIDNNLAERTIRKLTTQRNNSLHYGSDAGAEMAATYHSVIGTVKLHGSSIWNFIGTFFKNIFNGCRDYVNMVPDKITLAASQC